MIILCVLVVVFRAKRIAQYTNFPFYERDMDMGEDVNIVVLQEDGYREVKEQYVRRQRRKGMDTLVNLVMVLIITCGRSINVFVLFVSLSSPERETNYFGVIPFVFHTDPWSRRLCIMIWRSLMQSTNRSTACRAECSVP